MIAVHALPGVETSSRSAVDDAVLPPTAYRKPLIYPAPKYCRFEVVEESVDAMNPGALLRARDVDPHDVVETVHLEVLLPARDYKNRHASIMLALEATAEAIVKAEEAATA